MSNSIMDAEVHVTMPNGAVWAVPVSVIATNRAAYYAKYEFGGDVARSLQEDTIPLFEEEDYEIQNWAENNMNWSDVQASARQVSLPPSVDFQDGWVNGAKNVVRK